MHKYFEPVEATYIVRREDGVQIVILGSAVTSSNLLQPSQSLLSEVMIAIRVVNGQGV